MLRRVKRFGNVAQSRRWLYKRTALGNTAPRDIPLASLVSKTDPVHVCVRAHENCPCDRCQHHKENGQDHAELPTLHDWTYEGTKGPQNWHLIKGVHISTQQSPIDFVDNKLRFGNSKFCPSIHYFNTTPVNPRCAKVGRMNLTSSRHHSDACKPIQPAPLKVENTGHSLQINFPLSHDDNPVIPGGYVLLLGRKHHLRQIHFHAPSEHRVHGEAHRMEAHFVHATDRGQLLVMGLFMDVAGDGQEAATFLDWIIPVAGQCDIKGKQSEVEPSMDLEAVATVIRKSVSYYCYQGSLTTPPLSDGVYWLLCSDVVKFRLEVISAIETDLPKRNFRPAQLSHAHARPTNLRTEFRLFL